MTEFTVRPIGHVRSVRAGRIDDNWGDVESVIRLDIDRFTPDSVAGLDQFSHIEVIFLFDQFDEAKVAIGARHPRGNEAWPKVGIFAQRASSRPIGSASPPANCSVSTDSTCGFAGSMRSTARPCSISSRT